MSLQIIQAKPNPAGKESGKDQDVFEARRPEALFGEWVDVKNVGDEMVNFQTMQLRHALFDEDCHSTGELELYWIGDNGDPLKPGQVLRIHGGRRGGGRGSKIEDRRWRIEDRGSHRISLFDLQSSILNPQSSIFNRRVIQCFILKTSPQFAPAIFFARGLNLTRRGNIG